MGIDLVPLKTCTYNCIYCQLGRTPRTTIERRKYAPPDVVVDEIACRLHEGCEADYLTLSGSGEPTLHSGMGDLVTRIREMTPIPIAVLTNGSLLWNERVADAARRADLVVPSLDAGDETAFRRVNRPHPAIGFETMVDGLASFRDSFRGRLWLEIFLVRGANDSEHDLKRIARIARRTSPDRIHVNTVARPPAEDIARAVPDDRLREFAAALGDNAEVITAFDRHQTVAAAGARHTDVLDMLRRRPCSAQDVAQGLSLAPNEALKHLGILVQRGSARVERHDGVPFYVATDSDG
jgi:wyosine [tRNA(Phe)-imidazoG37] synthetase (radical SAM superfamily)